MSDMNVGMLGLIGMLGLACTLCIIWFLCLRCVGQDRRHRSPTKAKTYKKSIVVPMKTSSPEEQDNEKALGHQHLSIQESKINEPHPLASSPSAASTHALPLDQTRSPTRQISLKEQQQAINATNQEENQKQVARRLQSVMDDAVRINVHHQQQKIKSVEATQKRRESKKTKDTASRRNSKTTTKNTASKEINDAVLPPPPPPPK